MWFPAIWGRYIHLTPHHCSCWFSRTLFLPEISMKCLLNCSFLLLFFSVFKHILHMGIYTVTTRFQLRWLARPKFLLLHFLWPTEYELKKLDAHVVQDKTNPQNLSPRRNFCQNSFKFSYAFRSTAVLHSHILFCTIQTVLFLIHSCPWFPSNIDLYSCVQVYNSEL